MTVPPSELGSRGSAFWDHSVAAFERDRHEQELLTQVCRLLDRADALKAEVDEHGMMVESRWGRRPNPAIAEERQCSLALGDLVRGRVVVAGDPVGLAGSGSEGGEGAVGSPRRRWRVVRVRRPQSADAVVEGAVPECLRAGRCIEVWAPGSADPFFVAFQAWGQARSLCFERQGSGRGRRRGGRTRSDVRGRRGRTQRSSGRTPITWPRRWPVVACPSAGVLPRHQRSG